jgi:hypothetical protein
MPKETSDVEQAERLGRRRARMLPFLALIFLTQQISFFASETERTSAVIRSVDHAKFGAWMVLSLVLLAALHTGGFWFHRREVRALMDDEITQAHRATALSLGFLVAMLTAIALYLVDMAEPVGTRVAIHVIVTLGIASALLRFGYLERRAHA